MPADNNLLPGNPSYAQIFAFDGDVPFDWTDEQKLEAPLRSVSGVDLDSYSLNHEVICFEVSWLYFKPSADIDITVEFINMGTGDLLYQNTFHFTKFQLTDWAGAWYFRSWIGKAPWELNGPMTVVCNVMVDSTDPDARGEGQFYIEVTGSELPSECKESDITLNFNAIETEPKTFTFNGGVSSSNPECDITQITWDFGDGSGPMSGWFPQSHTYATDGVYNVTVTVEDNCCNTKSKTIMVTVGTPPPEWKVFDPPPAEFPEVWIPLLHELDDACHDNDAEAVKNILRTHVWETASPIVFVAALALVAKAVTAIATVLGAKAFSAFLFEETLQTIDMAVWEARSAKQWDLAQAAVNKKRELFETTFWDEVIDWIPGANVIMAVKKFKDASLFKLDLDQELINRQTPWGVEPKTGDIGGYIDALDAGQDTTPYRPQEEGLLQVNVNVPGGAIEVDGVGLSTLFPFSMGVEAGDHTVMVDAEGYVPKTKIVHVDYGESHIEDFYLEKEEIPPDKGTLHVTCNVSTADVYVNGTKRGVTPLTYTLDPGSYHILVTKFKHTSYETDVSIEADKTTEVSAEIMPEDEGEKAKMAVDSNPQGASIFKNGVDTTWTTPAVFENLDPGTYTIVLKLEGYPDAEQTITLNAGQSAEVYYDFTIPYYPPEEVIEVTMTPTTHEYNAWKYRFKAKDAVTGQEINAKIYIDDEDTGKWTPWYFYLEELKTYVIRLERYGYHPATVTVTTDKLPEAP